MPAEMEKLRRDNPARCPHMARRIRRQLRNQSLTRVTVGRLDVPLNAAPLFGMDFGFSVDPTAIVKVFHLPATSQLYVAAEA